MRTIPSLKHLAATALLIAFTGCITIEENYSFKKNGSGTMEYVVDLSELGDIMKSVNAAADSEAKKDDDLGTMDMNDEVAALKGIAGISKVKLDTKTEWVQKVRFSFKDISSLNAALNVLMPDSTGTPTTFFSWDGNTLVRSNNRHAYEIGAGMAKGGEEEEGAEEGDENGMDMSTILASMKYKYSFKFAQSTGETTAAPGVVVEQHGTKEVAMSTDFGVISKDPKALDLRIPLVK
ncbi:MAG: hypothetical protein ABI432_08850 [Flavobacteriales bacterium]